MDKPILPVTGPGGGLDLVCSFVDDVQRGITPEPIVLQWLAYALHRWVESDGKESLETLLELQARGRVSVFDGLQMEARDRIMLRWMDALVLLGANSGIAAEIAVTRRGWEGQLAPTTLEGKYRSKRERATAEQLADLVGNQQLREKFLAGFDSPYLDQRMKSIMLAAPAAVIAK